MTKITNLMELIDFPREAQFFFDEVFCKVEGDSELFSMLEKLENLYYEKFNCEELEAGLTALSEKSGYHKYTVDMLLALYAGLRLEKLYSEKGYTREFFKDNIKDLTYKLVECKKLHDIWGTFVFPWFYGFYNMTRFCLGRLQYDVNKVIKYGWKDIVKEGDTVLNCHIPSAGPLTPELVEDSFLKAYEFFGPNYGDKLVIMCESWMLYPVMCDLLPKDSNMRKFYECFEILHQQVNVEDYDLWRVFYKQTDDYSSLEQKTTLQKILYKHLNNGGHFGYGYGVAAYKPNN